MDIRKFISTAAVIICPIFTYAHAGQILDDICSKTPGHWDGIYTLKNQNDCKLDKYNGCTHLVMADVSYISQNEYHISLNPAVGTGGKFNVKCENGVVTSPVNPGNKISLSCNSMNHCFVVYDDARLTAEMRKE